MHIKIIFTLLISAPLITCSAGPIAEALALLPKAPYGFCFSENHITPDLLKDYDQLHIQKTQTYNQFGAFESLENNLEDFLQNITNNDIPVIQRIAAHITQIVAEVMIASGRETGWVSLRATIPTDAYDMPRWHMDGYYFNPADPQEMLYKYVVTLRGPATLFYPLCYEERKKVCRKTMYRDYMVEFCKKESIVQPHHGQGAFLLGGRIPQTALHSEPPIPEPRLFLSVVPCNANQLIELQKKVRIT